MDSYTKQTREWLDRRFRAVDDAGVYIAHQPIYGFNGLHCEPAIIEKYVRTFQIMKALARVRFRSFLDVGGAEGYRAFIVREMFGAEVRNCDLSEEACRRAREIFRVDSDVVDMHSLPYADASFDAVLCSESLEHLTDFRTGVNELLRIARKAVIITVPHESEEVIHHNIEEGIPHAHIHNFDLDSFKFLESQGYKVACKRIVSPHLRFPGSVLPVQRKENSERLPAVLLDIYNRAVPVLRFAAGHWAAAALVRIDEILCEISSQYDAALFVISREPVDGSPTTSVTARRIIGYSAPLHVINGAGL